jgi:hypothetical protein
MKQSGAGAVAMPTLSPQLMRLTGLERLVLSLATWRGPLQGVAIENAADDGVVVAIYADLHRGGLAGCIGAADVSRVTPAQVD